MHGHSYKGSLSDESKLFKQLALFSLYVEH
jgi:hypothetical protein